MTSFCFIDPLLRGHRRIPSGCSAGFEHRYARRLRRVSNDERLHRVHQGCGTAHGATRVTVLRICTVGRAGAKTPCSLGRVAIRYVLSHMDGWAVRIASMNFATTLLGWHDFYAITGTAAASLVGLLFVGLSLHLRVVVTRPEVEGLARVTLTGFAVTLVTSLFMVVPRSGDASSIGWDLVGLGGVAAALIVRSLVTGIRSEYRTLSAQRLILRFGSSALSIIGVIAIGGVFVGGDFEDGFAWLSGIAIFLLLTSLRNSWDLLVSVGRAIQAPSHP
jgi:hypothetical protein